MEIRTTEESMENIINYAKSIHTLQLQKKVLDDEIKEIKQHYKEEGVAVGKVTKVLTALKAKAKQTEADLFEEALIEEHLSKNEEIQDNIAALNNG